MTGALQQLDLEAKFKAFRMNEEEINEYLKIEEELGRNVHKVRGKGFVMATISTKGGTGKTVSTKLIALAAAELGLKVCIIDACANSSIATGFFRDRKEFTKTTFDWLTDADNSIKLSELIHPYKDTGIYYMPSNRTISEFDAWFTRNLTRPKRETYLSDKLKPLQKVFDLIIVDTHPSEDDVIVDSLFTTANFILIPTELDLDSIIGSERVIEICNDFKEAGTPLKFGVLFNKVGHLSTALKQLSRFTEQLKNDFDLENTHFLGKIRHSEKIPFSKNDGVMLNELNDIYATRVMYDVKHILLNILKQQEEQ